MVEPTPPRRSIRCDPRILPLRHPTREPIRRGIRAAPRWIRKPRFRRIALALGVVALVGLTGPVHAAEPGVPRLGGYVAIDSLMTRHWCWSGSWIYPVGDSCASEQDGEGRYLVNRGIERHSDGSLEHQGVDLCNRCAGGIVRAAASGVVVKAETRTASGYGAHVVLGHRLEEGGLAYSVYAHLRPGSIALAEGQTVAAGQPLGRVGRSGRASTDHLHFEIRLAQEPGVRWERCAVVDPMAFVEARRSCRGDDSTWRRPYLEWAERAALVDRGVRGDLPLARHRWWRMVARAACHTIPNLPAEPGELRRVLIDRGLLPADAPEADDPMSPTEVARDLELLGNAGLRVPGFVTRAGGEESPGRSGSRAPADSIFDRDPSIADACRAIARMSIRQEPLGLERH